MAKKLLQQPLTKTYTDAEVLQLWNKALTVLGREAENGSVYTIAILREIFSSNNEGTGPTTTKAQNQIPTQNPTQQPTTKQQVLNIESKSASAVSY